MIRRTLLFFSVLVPNMLLAQVQILLVDNETNLPVKDAFVKGYSTEWFYQVSNSKGMIMLPDNFPIALWISHINYAPIIDTLDFPESKTYRLKSSFKPLEEVVITGQYEPQSASNSVYKVTSITKAEIKNRGATNLDEVLNTKLNLRLQNDPATGTTGISIQGISGENVKVLIDGVAVAGRVGNQIDLGQIDITLIEKIEIVEGPMAVSYGSNAMGGVINIITVKSSPKDWNVNLSFNEESIGSNFSLSDGIHNQLIGGSINLNEKWFTRATFSHKYFGGYKAEGNDRSYTWDPKTQFIGSFLLKFTPGKFNTFYKLDVLDELIESPGESTGLFDALAIDETYKTKRIVHQLQTTYPVSSKSRLNALFAYTDYKRLKSQYITRISNGEQLLSAANGAQDTTLLDAFNFRGSYVALTTKGNISYELGYDINLESGQGGRIKGNEKKTINDAALFASSEFKFSTVTIRPGFRIAHNSIFNTPIVPSLNVKWTPNIRWNYRMGIGRGFRAPSLKELYFEFVDSNHSIFGNENLKPEDGTHLDMGLTFTPNEPSSYQFVFFYNDLQNQITFGQSPLDPTSTSYINIDKFKSVGSNGVVTYSSNNLSSELGIGIIGRSSNLDQSGYLFTPEIVFSTTYRFTQKLSAGVFYKYTGITPRYELSNDPQQSPNIIKTEDYSWMDITSRYSFSKSFDLTGGIKNVFDITQVGTGTGTGTGSGHGSGATNFVGYGRSFFLKLDITIDGNIKSNNK